MLHTRRLARHKPVCHCRTWAAAIPVEIFFATSSAPAHVFPLWRADEWALDQQLVFLGTVVAIVIACLPPIRRFLTRRGRSIMLRAGFPHRHYAIPL
jgi:hypothetical protein